jgi:hypothetical protein
LNECAVRWRLGKSFQRLALFDALIQKYHGRALELVDLIPTFNLVQKSEYNNMRRADVTYYGTTLKTFKKAMHRGLVRFGQDVGQLGPGDASQADEGMQLLVRVLEEIVVCPVWAFKKVRAYVNRQEDTSVKSLEDQVLQEILESIHERFRSINERLACQEGIRPIQRLILLSKAVNQEINRYGMCFPTPIVVAGSVNSIQIKEVTAETCLKYLILEVLFSIPHSCQLENMRYDLEDDDYAIKETLELYQVVRLLYDVCADSKLAYLLFPPNYRQYC